MLEKFSKLDLWKTYAVDIRNTIWASSRDNLFSVVCEQQRHRPTCASAQSDQCLCYSLFGEHSRQACSIQNFIFLASLCRCGHWFEYHYVRNPVDGFSRDEAHISLGFFNTLGQIKKVNLVA